MLMDVIQIIKPDPDSHFTLRPCRECTESDAAYVRYERQGRELWRVECFSCGAVVDIGAIARHDAQLAWNHQDGR